MNIKEVIIWFFTYTESSSKKCCPIMFSKKGGEGKEEKEGRKEGQGEKNEKKSGFMIKKVCKCVVHSHL